MYLPYSHHQPTTPGMSVGVGKRKERCVGGRLHIDTGMKVLVAVGLVVLLLLLSLLLLKFKKASFVLLIPFTISLCTIIGIVSRRHLFIWPVIAISCFHIILASYGILIFLFYFIFKPFYIIMVLNWAFDTLHNDKTPSYYIQCGGIFATLLVFLLFNLWQCSVAYSFHRMLLRSAKSSDRLSDRRESSPTILVVNKPVEYISSQY